MSRTEVFVIVLLAVCYSAFGQVPGCPLEEDTAPCICTNSPITVLTCQNIVDAEVLRTVFINSEKYSYREVHLEYSTLPFLPHDIFETVRVTELYLLNTTLIRLFDRPPQALDELRKLHIENSRVTRGIIWKLLEPLKSLRILDVYFMKVKKLGNDFSQYATKDLEQLTFYGTETNSISPGTFVNFTKLVKVAIDAGKLTSLTRDIFPNPFNVQALYFNDHAISKIPSDLFTQMPRLNTVSLRINQIATIDESAFDNNVQRITYVRLDDNPLKCDCRLVYLVKNKPEMLRGTCATPKRLQGRQLQDLTLGDFAC